MTRIFFTLVLSLTSLSVFSQDQTFRNEPEETGIDAPSDNTPLIKKSFAIDQIEDFRADPAFNYQQPPSIAESFWSRFLEWIGSLLESIFQAATRTSAGRILLYTGGIILLIVIVMALLKVNAFRVFFKGADEGKVQPIGIYENIHEMDFEKLLNDAIGNGEYRVGVRLTFLHALKILSNHHLIDWQAGKTNRDYVNEMRSRELKDELDQMSYYFDYAWYGGFHVTRETYTRVAHIFSSWKKKISN